MAKYKPYDLNQMKMIPLSYADQVVEGSFEHALSEIVEEHLDLGVFERRYRNDETGRPAYDPKILLKVILYGYYKGIISSRQLAEACRRNVVFMALSADTRPHFTTLAAFVSELDREIVGLFRDVLLYASELGLIGKEHFAVDGCKLPSNASKQWSGTHRELEEKRKKLERVAERIVERHREHDGQESPLTRRVVPVCLRQVSTRRTRLAVDPFPKLYSFDRATFLTGACVRTWSRLRSIARSDMLGVAGESQRQPVRSRYAQ
jgi:transposase